MNLNWADKNNSQTSHPYESNDHIMINAKITDIMDYMSPHFKLDYNDVSSGKMLLEIDLKTQ
jgi:hypothetical protein